MSIRLPYKHKRLLAYIKAYTVAHGYAPTLREIALSCDIKSVSTVKFHLDKLALAGHLDYQPKQSRTLRVVGSPRTSAMRRIQHENTTSWIGDNFGVDLITLDGSVLIVLDNDTKGERLTSRFAVRSVAALDDVIACLLEVRDEAAEVEAKVKRAKIS